MKPVSVLDVAKYITNKAGEITAMKLQKLAYYSQVWSLVWDESCLFVEPIKARANGPIIDKLYEAHRGLFKVNTSTFRKLGKISNLSRAQKDTVDEVLNFYGDKTAYYLIELSRMEDPWAHTKVPNVIKPEVMYNYYSGLLVEDSEE